MLVSNRIFAWFNSTELLVIEYLHDLISQSYYFHKYLLWHLQSLTFFTGTINNAQNGYIVIYINKWTNRDNTHHLQFNYLCQEQEYTKSLQRIFSTKTENLLQTSQ